MLKLWFSFYLKNLGLLLYLYLFSILHLQNNCKDGSNFPFALDRVFVPCQYNYSKLSTLLPGSLFSLLQFVSASLLSLYNLVLFSTDFH